MTEINKDLKWWIFLIPGTEVKKIFNGSKIGYNAVNGSSKKKRYLS